jgi:exosortase H (IPTLxxWG-CTERM-specific)
MARDKHAPPRGDWRRYRQEISFVVLFALLLGASFTLISVNWVNDHAVEPFTAWIARASATVLRLVGQPVTVDGTVIRSPGFAVNIRNGCNGLETVAIFLSAVLAFPARWPSKIMGGILGFLAIQLVNLARVAALFLTGVYLPQFFNTSHTVVWQTVVVFCGVLLWLFWAARLAAPKPLPS